VDALLSDGMHPNDAGHALEADALLPIIREMFDLPGA
jgi:lysophospholipase L1-like esterase